MRPVSVLVLCTGNSARSILAEVLFNELGQGRVCAYSAGSKPAGAVNPGAIRKLADAGHDSNGLESKSWHRFSGPDAPPVDIVITVCDNAAGESCPVWSGGPVTIHWGIADPAAVTEDDEAIRLAFDQAYDSLKARVEAMLALPLGELDPAELGLALQSIHDRQCEKELA